MNHYFLGNFRIRLKVLRKPQTSRHEMAHFCSRRIYFSNYLYNQVTFKIVFFDKKKFGIELNRRISTTSTLSAQVFRDNRSKCFVSSILCSLSPKATPYL